MSADAGAWKALAGERAWCSRLIAVVKNQNGELAEEVVDREVVGKGPAETAQERIVDSTPMPESPQEPPAAPDGRPVRTP